MMNKKNRAVVIAEILIMVIATIATAYIIHEASKQSEVLNNNERQVGLLFLIFSLYKNFVKYVIGDKGLVSATDGQVYTCVQDKNGSLCQEYPILNSGDADKCNAACNSTCLPATRNKVEACKLGVCYDPVEGACLANSPKLQCQSTGGTWKADSFANIPQCQKGCCFVSDQAFFATSQECKRKGQVLGINQVFKPEVRTELECLVQANTQETGACVFTQDFENTCKFGTRAACLQMQGQFNPGLLCSNPDLKTNCKPQTKTGCVDGKDGIYWFDSCGNQENIYDANKVLSYNNGRVGNESCAIGTSANPLANQGTCGNCNYLLGSRCGAKTGSEKLADSSQDFVCRDLRCKDSGGNVRNNGESWCAYQGAIGTDIGVGTGSDGNPLLRSIDTAGSRHFRQSCVDGEVQTDPCADSRNEICVEAKSPLANGKTFSSAACRLNQWQMCLNYNNGEDKEQNLADCAKNDDCFVKEIAVSEFAFKICAPKYPVGFDLTNNGQSAQKLCSFATQKCTVVYVKGWGGWECKANCECETAKFGEQMNDMCMSLGDCGTKVNYVGDLTNNVKIKNSPVLGSDYTNKLKTYATPVKDKVASPGNISNFYGEVGIPEGLGTADYEQQKSSMMMGLVAGGMGVAIAYGISLAVAEGSAALTAGMTAAQASAVIAMHSTGTLAGAGINGALGTTGATGVTLGALGGALAGAAIGFAVVSLLINFLVPGMDPTMAMALSIAGAIGAGMIGYALMNGGLSSVGALGPIGVIILVIVIIIIIIAAILGIGKKKEVIVEFNCNPWQAPTGGAKCSQCGQDSGNAFGNSKLPCSSYACHSLGQTCELVNEGTGKELCVDINPNDVTPPVISPLLGVLQNGSSYDKISSDGFTIIGTGEEGCFKSNQLITLGIGLNEAGQCAFETKHSNSFKDMTNDFPDNLFTYNHTVGFSVPSLDSLGLPGYDPNRKADYSLYVRCQDKRGNANVNEYTINFCIKPGNDITPPIITAREPVNEWIPYGANSTNATIYTNEPADCKWSKVNQDYDIMNNSLSCDNALAHQQLLGWKCNANIPVVNNTEVVYVRCKDQPWLINDNTISVNGGQDSSGNNLTTNVTLDKPRTRNKNMESYEYNIKRATNPLAIDYLIPGNGTLTFGTEPASVDMEAQTSGGVDGNAICSYKWGNNWVLFFDTGESVHKQQFQSFFSGEREIPVQCVDSAGDVANAVSKFTVFIDRNVPQVTRAFNQAGNLVIVTNKPSQCSVSYNSCNFDFANGTLMSGEDLIHVGSYSKIQTSYIKCKDQFGNVPGGCSIQVKGGN